MSSTNKIVITYAKSLFRNIQASKNKEDSSKLSKITSEQQKQAAVSVNIIGEELRLISSIILSSKKLRVFFKNPTYMETQKLEMILTIFPGLSITMKSFLKVLTEKNQLYLLPEISDEYDAMLFKFKNITKLKLITASALDQKFGSAILSTLKKLTQAKNILLNFSYNPKLLGGVVLEYNSVAIDASILKEFSLFFNDI